MYELVVYIDLSLLQRVRYQMKTLQECYDCMFDLKNSLSFLNEDFYVRIKNEKKEYAYFKIGKEIKSIPQEDFIKVIKEDMDKNLLK